LVESMRGERRQLEKGGAGIEQQLDPLSHEQLTARLVAIELGLATAQLGGLEVAFERGGEGAGVGGVGLELVARGVEVGLDEFHGGSGLPRARGRWPGRYNRGGARFLSERAAAPPGARPPPGEAGGRSERSPPTRRSAA